MFWQDLKPHPTPAEALPLGRWAVWDCTDRTAAADLAPQVAHSLAETVPGKLGSSLGMEGVVGRGRWKGSWASHPKAHSHVIISDLFSLEMLENPEKEEHWELHSQEDHVPPKKEATVSHMGLVVSLDGDWVHQ